MFVKCTVLGLMDVSQEIAVKRILEEKWRQIGQEASHKLLFTFITELQVMHNHPAENILPIMAVR